MAFVLRRHQPFSILCSDRVSATGSGKASSPASASTFSILCSDRVSATKPPAPGLGGAVFLSVSSVRIECLQLAGRTDGRWAQLRLSVSSVRIECLQLIVHRGYLGQQVCLSVSSVRIECLQLLGGAEPAAAGHLAFSILCSDRVSATYPNRRGAPETCGLSVSSVRIECLQPDGIIQMTGGQPRLSVSSVRIECLQPQ